MMTFETRLMSAGMLYSPSDWSIPTKENARPVKIIMGNMIRVSCTAREVASALSSGATNLTSRGASPTPAAAMTAVAMRMKFTYELAYSRASFLPFFTRIELNTGMNAAVTTPPMTKSNIMTGRLDAAAYACAATSVP